MLQDYIDNFMPINAKNDENKHVYISGSMLCLFIIFRSKASHLCTLKNDTEVLAKWLKMLFVHIWVKSENVKQICMKLQLGQL